jgi:pumilio RNA-binding family
MYTSLRSTPSPHLQAYAASVDYGSSFPMVLPGGAIYGPGINPRAMHIYQQGIRPGCRSDGNEPSVALRSPLLDEFRANKARKWELRASVIYFYR